MDAPVQFHYLPIGKPNRIFSRHTARTLDGLAERGGSTEADPSVLSVGAGEVRGIRHGAKIQHGKLKENHSKWWLQLKKSESDQYGSIIPRKG